ncbi:uncharacterized protein LOC128126289 [Lactuca sativa]|uniref:uncharacterized protein LOC128126289 n=1 Tax=Lactuca sativa TaxID=4236 RepID=UPI0022AEB35E|nr:uncharacterized protein LOC128126289 [Lactuca sativa]
MKIIVSDSSKFQFVGSIPESMYGCVPNDSRIIRTYKEFHRSGPRELIPEMIQSIHDADRPAPKGKKQDKGKDKKVVKGAKGPSPKKRKPSKEAQSPPPKKRKTQPRRKLILASSSSESEEESSDSEESLREATTTTTAGVRTNVSDTGAPTSAPEPTPPSPSSPDQTAEDEEPFLRGEDMTFDSGSAHSNAEKLDSLVHKLATSVASELQSFASLRQSLNDDNKLFQATIEERLTKLQEDLASENSVMDALARKTTALKVKSLHLFQSEKEVASL